MRVLADACQDPGLAGLFASSGSNGGGSGDVYRRLAAQVQLGMDIVQKPHATRRVSFAGDHMTDGVSGVCRTVSGLIESCVTSPSPEHQVGLKMRTNLGRDGSTSRVPRYRCSPSRMPQSAIRRERAPRWCVSASFTVSRHNAAIVAI